jgi:FkbM family methyltransferase
MKKSSKLFLKVYETLRRLFLRILNPSKVKHRGVYLSLDSDAISPYIKNVVLSGSYESKESILLEKTLEANDRVLELGSGMGFISCFCAKILGSGAAVHAVEALPDMAPIIRNNFKLNGYNIDLTTAAVGRVAGEIEFAVADNFWSSSNQAKTGKERMIKVPMVALDELIRLHEPTYLVVDVEGMEKELFDCDLGSVRKICLEVHPHYVGDEGVHQALDDLRERGFKIDFLKSSMSVLFFYR